MAIVNAEKLGELLRLTKQRIYQLVKVGMPKTGRGQFDAAKCTLWYVHFLQDALNRKTPQNNSEENKDLRKEKTLLIRVQRELAELQLAEKRRQLISVLDSAAIWEDAIIRTRARLLAVKNKHAGQLVGLKSIKEAQAKLDVIIVEALQEMVAVGDEDKT